MTLQQPGHERNVFAECSSSERAAWQLPRGVSRGTWDYVQTVSIAREYDAYFAEHPLLKLDMDVVRQHLPPMQHPAPIIADFGCGTGRVACELVPLGYRVLCVDLSRHMLADVQQKAGQNSILAAPVQANLVELDWLRPSSLDFAVCLFSSIGMIRGRQHRRVFLRSVQLSLKPGATFMLHVHNRHHSWLDPEGPRWLISTWLRSLLGQACEFGDRTYLYRGLPSMYLHIYSRRELLADLSWAGIKKVELLPINRTTDSLLSQKATLLNLRAGGFFAICN